MVRVNTTTPTTSLANKFSIVTIPEGQLPIAPQITPGWGVAGIIMLVTGAIYTMVGIKNRWIHTFFSTAYICALGVAVLIIYVMNIPVSDALQGGYVAAIVVSGCALGAASMFFKELTEGLGCALGGFCISMWLLCLVPGGLLRTVASKAIFIAAFTVVGFAFYFSRYTRDWALIVLISFGGATVTVLGIDSFSRAGLKEFWAYIWDLNQNLFPLGADTYPVTKGIRVETAAIIIIFLVGIISQIKLWRIVREKRDKRAAQRAEGQRNLEQEEENVGRQVEETTARERREWERIYGDGAAESVTASHYSEGADASSEKQLRGVVYAGRHQSSDDIEMEDMSESSHGPDALMADEKEEGKITVRVAADEVPEYERDEEFDEKDDGTVMPAGADAAFQRHSKRHSANSGKSRRVSRNNAQEKRYSARSYPSPQMTQPPEVVPLPFTVPAGQEQTARSERSSVATFADEEDCDDNHRPKRRSMVKRLSQGSATLLRSLSQKSGLANELHATTDNGQSSEELVERARHDDDNGSLAATVDNESESGADAYSIASEQDRKSKSIEINAELADRTTPEAKERKAIPPAQGAPATITTVRKSSAVADRVAAITAMEQQLTVPKQQRATSPKVDQTPSVSEAPQSPVPPESSVHEPQPEPQPAFSEAPKSAVSEVSGPISLTRERLPSSLSRVALSYRTNEWAKHLSNADMPEPDELPVEKPRRASKVQKEKAKPVNVDDLQKTAEEGVPPVVVKRSESRSSLASAAPSAATNTAPVAANTPPADAPIPSPPAAAEPEPPVQSAKPPAPSPGPFRRASATALRKTPSVIQPIAEEEDVRHSSPSIPEEQSQQPPRPPSASPSLSQHEAYNRAPVPGIVSYASPQTLLGQREVFLRSRSQGSLVSNIGEMQNQSHSPPSESGSIHNYPMYAAALAADPDDVPLSQRKEIMRQSSLMSLNTSSPSLHRPDSRIDSRTDSPIGAENIAFNSHQPQRTSGVPSNAAREAKLANFRLSVSQELRSGSPMVNTIGRETPFASTNSLLGGREVEVQRNIEMQRHVLMGQKEAEAQRKEMQRRDKEFSDRAFDDRMRSGDLMEAHREAMRKMQRGSRR